MSDVYHGRVFCNFISPCLTKIQRTGFWSGHRFNIDVAPIPQEFTEYLQSRFKMDITGIDFITVKGEGNYSVDTVCYIDPENEGSSIKAYSEYVDFKDCIGEGINDEQLLIDLSALDAVVFVDIDGTNTLSKKTIQACNIAKYSMTTSEFFEKYKLLQWQCVPK